MKRTAVIIALLPVLGLSGPVQASDPVGIYAIVDKVVLEPNEEAPERVQIWGTFALAKPDSGGNQWELPARGYFYFAAPRGKEDVCRKEWNDLKKLAGTGECVAFGTSYEIRKVGKVRRASDKPVTPDPYPVASGLTKARRSVDYAPVRNVLTFPGPVSPADGSEVAPGKVTLVVKNVADKERKNAKYVFEIATASSAEKSTPVAAGDKETKFTPQLEIKAGEKYTWRVWIVDGDFKGPVASAEFKGKG